MLLSQYIPGFRAIGYYGVETSYPEGETDPGTVAVPSTVYFLSYADVIQVQINDNARGLYGIGANGEALTSLPGGRDIDLTVTPRIVDKAFLQKCFYNPTGTGLGGVPDLCIVGGTSDVDGDGDARAFRFCKCNSGSISIQSGAADIQANLQFMAMAEDLGSALTPDPAAVAASPLPLNWNHVTAINVNGSNVRNNVQSVSFDWNHNCERKVYRRDFGVSSIWSRTTTAIMPRNKSYSATLNFHSPDAAAAFMGKLGTTATAISGFSVVLSDAGTEQQGTVARTFTFTGTGARLATQTRNGGDSGNELTSSVTLLLNTLRLT